MKFDLSTLDKPLHVGVCATSYELEDLSQPSFEDLNGKAYKFNIAWHQILPNGRGRANIDQLGRYEKFIDTLLNNNIIPYAVLNENLLPETLAEKGGWLSKDTSKYFADYAATIASKFENKVHCWVTHNEVSTLSELVFNKDNPQKDPFIRCHNILIAHGLSVDALRSESSSPISITQIPDLEHLIWILEPILKQSYPKPMTDKYATVNILALLSSEQSVISQGVDIVGVNDNLEDKLEPNFLLSTIQQQYEIEEFMLSDTIKSVQKDANLIEDRLGYITAQKDQHIKSYFIKPLFSPQENIKLNETREHTLTELIRWMRTLC